MSLKQRSSQSLICFDHIRIPLITYLPPTTSYADFIYTIWTWKLNSTEPSIKMGIVQIPMHTRVIHFKTACDYICSSPLQTWNPQPNEHQPKPIHVS
jgi:hypothetical protein